MERILLSAKSAMEVGAIVWQKLFQEHLLATNILISTLMSGSGDLLAQHYEKFTKKNEAQDLKTSTVEIDKVRTFRITASGVTTGAVSHYWYLILDKWLPGRSARILIKKLLADQFIYSPICLCTFFSTLTMLGGTNGHSFKDEIINKGTTIYTAELFVWPPLQAFNYGVLSTKYRVMFDNVISFGFCVYSPYIIYKNTDKNENFKTVSEKV